ncbi:MAG: 4Fe-4S binding protein [Nocardiopsaceae bacterium]|nr:4Fe-4S binding protein [Nocardiopsaceae bacterium]
MAAVMTIGACQGCGACLLTCPEHAIRPLEGTLRVLPDRCTGCGECLEICPVDAISEVSPVSPVDAVTEASTGSEDNP